METQPVLTIVAGANGSGKTTFARPYTKKKHLQFLNADDLTKEYELRGEENAMMKGGREFFKLLNNALASKADIAIETTLSGTYTTKVVAKARKLGYHIEMIYIYLADADICVKRVANRVSLGGHHVPEEDIRRRYYRSITNFRDNYPLLADVWFLYHNGWQGYQSVANYDGTVVNVTHEELYTSFNKIGNDV